MKEQCFLYLLIFISDYIKFLIVKTANVMLIHRDDRKDHLSKELSIVTPASCVLLKIFIYYANEFSFVYLSVYCMHG